MSPRRLLLLLVVAALPPACGGGAPIPDEDLPLRVTAGAEEVALGKAFPLTVVRVWSREAVRRAVGSSSRCRGSSPSP